MARLRKPHESPPDDFTFVQPETGGRWTGETLDQLVGIVVEHRIWKGLQRATRDEVREDIERQICSGMPPGICRPEPGEDYQPFEDQARGMTAESLMHVSKYAFDFIRSGGEMVPKAESERRAAICRGCRFNRPSPCTVCTPAFKLIDAIIPSNRVEPGLSACGICGCGLKAIVLLPLQPDNYRYPSHCWHNG